MKGSPNKDAAWDLVRYTVAPERQSQMPAHVAYGSTNLKSNDLTPPEFAKERDARGLFEFTLIGSAFDARVKQDVERFKVLAKEAGM